MQVSSVSRAADGQPHVEIRAYQGERETCPGNKLLGRFTFVGIPGPPRGVPQIESSFDVDQNSIWSVSAMDTSTGKEQKTKIENHGGLSRDEIEKFLADQQKSAEADKKEKALREAAHKTRKSCRIKKLIIGIHFVSPALFPGGMRLLMADFSRRTRGIAPKY
jgi:molecular chaperone DnaK